MKKKKKFKAWQRISRKVLYRHPAHSYFLDEIYLPDGRVHEYVHAKIIPGVLIVALNSKKEVCLISQYRYVHKKKFLELPGGGADTGKDFLYHAKKELFEETGFKAKKWSKLGRFHSMPGQTDSAINIYLAEGLKKQGSGSDMFIEGISRVQFVSLEKALAMIQAGKISHATTVIGILLAAKKLKAL